MATLEEQIYNAYISGQMTPEETQQFEADVNSGVFALPPGKSLIKNQTSSQTQQINQPKQQQISQPSIPKVSKMPQQVIDAYRRGEMNPEEKAQFEQDMNKLAGIPAIPEKFEKKPYEMGLKEMITGEKRRTPESESLPDWTTMPEMNSLSLDAIKNVLFSFVSSPNEAAKIIKESNPGVSVRYDEKGNLIMQSAKDGNEYVVKPGFRVSDIPRALSQMVLWSTGGGSMGTVGKTGLAMGKQAGIEAAQYAAGGEVNPEEIALTGGTELGFGLAGKGITAAKGIRAAESEAQAAVRGAEQAGISPMTSDVFPPKTFVGKLVRSVTERIPVVGTGPVRAAKQESRVEAIRNVLREYGATETAQASDDVMKSVLKKRSSELTKYSKMKREVIERLTMTNADLMEQGIKETGGYAPSGLKKAVSTETIPKAQLIVSVENTNKAIKNGIEALSERRTTEAQKAIDLLSEYGDAFQNSNLSNLEELRKELGNKLKSPDLATVRSTAEKELSKIYSALNEDMGNYIQKFGERKDFVKWKVANKRLSEMAGELKINTLRSVLKDGKERPEVVRKMLFSVKPSEIRMLNRNLTPEGRSAAKVAILQEAASKAGGVENLSTAKFSSALKRLQKSTGVFFTGTDKKVIEGLQKALDLTKQAEIAGIKPTTGAELTAFTAPTAISWLFGGSPIIGLGATAGIGGLARAYESRPVRNALLMLAKGKPGKEKILMQNLVNAVQSARQSQDK